MKIISLIFILIFSNNLFSETGYDHGQNMTFCYDSNSEELGTMSYTNEYYLSVDSRGSAGRVTVYYMKDYVILSEITLIGAKIVDLDNDGKCEVMGYEDFVNYIWDIPNGHGQVLKLYEISYGKFKDLNIRHNDNKKIKALYKKETDKLINDINENKHYTLGDKEGWSDPLRGCARPIWASILAMNPNEYGVKLFSQYYNETFTKQDLIDIETKLFGQGYWSEEFYKSHPLLSLQKK